MVARTAVTKIAPQAPAIISATRATASAIAIAAAAGLLQHKHDAAKFNAAIYASN
ncbi:hypothetical protein CERSUDRAFT_101523 [Gelatoporia subvermispora B]|uniref:Uncharacterized protein n=1 Tax=Ceriporiopsis subvermispora (strain B) TaxID=914234 RepID=M2QUZ6_CERS8|nr:hypothetical protein CERSUDRAFT_101523 [Gelatoporia subvermispora B]